MTTKYVIINDPTARNHAYMMSKWAIDIQYDCPKCGKDRVVTWLFPTRICYMWTSVAVKKCILRGLKMKESDLKLLCVLLMNQIYNDIRMIVREELERAKDE